MRSLGLALAVLSIATVGAPAEDYVLGPDSQPQAGVPRGEVTKYNWTSTIFPGTVRDYWVYVPTQYDPAARLRDGLSGRRRLRQGRTAQWRVPIVFDNLIHKKEMPVTIGVFINPGVVPAPATNALAALQPQLRVRRARRQLRALPARGDPARGRQELQPVDQRGNDRAIAGASSRRRSAPSPRPGSGPTPSARVLQHHRQLTSTCAAATSTRRSSARPSRSRSASSCRTAPAI